MADGDGDPRQLLKLWTNYEFACNRYNIEESCTDPDENQVAEARSKCWASWAALRRYIFTQMKP